MLQADLGLFLLFYDKSIFAGVFIFLYLYFRCIYLRHAGVVWYEKSGFHRLAEPPY